MGRLFRDQLLHERPASEDENPVRDSLQFDEIGRKQQHRRALCGEFVNDPVDLCFRANIDTYGGFVEQVQVRARAKPFRQDDLLLVAAGELTRRRFGTRRANLQVVHPLLYQFLLATTIYHEMPHEARKACKRDVLADRQVERDAMRSPVLRHESDATAHGIARIVRHVSSAIQFDLPAHAGFESEQAAHDGFAARP